MPELKFSGLQISNEPGYFKSGNWSIVDGSLSDVTRWLGLDLSFATDVNDKFKLLEFGDDPNTTEVGLSFDAILGFLPDLMGIDFNTDMNVIGKLQETNGIQEWVFSRFEVGKIYLKKGFTGASFSGDIELQYQSNHPDFGDTFRGIGNVKLGVSKFQIDLRTVLQLGIKNGKKTFFIDALVKKGIPIGTSGLKFGYT